ncbi:MAG: tetratricopeptide repeat protein [Chitinophagaceae bacterium]|nr:tetratricopeptide repeat protein [Chitinophagaceae bacterium]
MRRLSAIMFTDMVGYSALSQKNEALALELLDEHRKILRPIFPVHNGREIETAGDSFFVEFQSAVEAAHCAIEIQSALHQRNTTEPAQRHITLRIGLHIGDVVYVDNHVHGDGVNIAARMEPLAVPGGICISEDVARQIRNKVPYPVIQLENEKLKNISMPMDIYCIALPWISQHQRIKKTVFPKKRIAYAIGSAILLFVLAWFFFIRNSNKELTQSGLRLAVLPFKNISANQDDEYFADGMTEELISTLAKIGGLNVIARTSVMKYKITDKDISEIGNELMVSTILEGSVRKTENKARITVTLVNASNQEHIWSDEYTEELKDIFMVQSEIAQDVANELKIRLVSSEKEQLQKKGTADPIASEEYLIGKSFLNQRTPQGIHSALVHFEKAIVRDPSFALAHTNLAYCYTLIGVAGYGNIARDVAEKKAKEAVMKALEIDPTLAEAHAALGYIKFRIDWDWDGAEREFKKAIEIKPGYATAHEWYALYLAIQRRFDEALKEMNIAYQLDPLSPNVNTGLARIHQFMNNTDKSLQQVNKTLAIDSNYAEAYFTAGMTYFKRQEYEKAIQNLNKAIALANRRPVMLCILGASYVKTGRLAEAKQLLAELQTPPVNNDKLYAIAIIKSHLGQLNEALLIMEKLIDEKYGIMIYMNTDTTFFQQGGDTRFRKLLQKMNFK